MLVSISIPDAVYDQYVKQNPTNPRLAMQQQLERFQDVGKGDRPLVLKKEVLRKLEAHHGVPLENEEMLLKWVENLVNFKVDDITIALREGQRKHIASEAQFYKRSPSEHATVRIKQAIDSGLGGF